MISMKTGEVQLSDSLIAGSGVSIYEVFNTKIYTSNGIVQDRMLSLDFSTIHLGKVKFDEAVFNVVLYFNKNTKLLEKIELYSTNVINSVEQEIKNLNVFLRSQISKSNLYAHFISEDPNNITDEISFKFNWGLVGVFYDDRRGFAYIAISYKKHNQDYYL